MTLEEVAKELREMDAQFVHHRENPFARMAEAVESAIKTIGEIDYTLRVPAAEYVPAIGDAFNLIDSLGLTR